MATEDMSESCKICARPVVVHGRATVRAKYDATFVRCHYCGFISLVNPSWLPEAYAQPINESDTGYLARNLWCQERVRMVIELLLDPDGTYLDYAAGYGVFVRLMRDVGYDFRWSDAYCDNLFARQFAEPLPLTSHYEAITAFEVLEHLVSPMDDLSQLAQLTSCLIVSTDVVPPLPPAPADWWYYGLEHGQHVSFYSLSTLQYIANSLKLSLTTDGVSFHLLTKHPCPANVLRRVDNRLWRALIRRTRKRMSKRDSDREWIARLPGAGQS